MLLNELWTQNTILQFVHDFNVDFLKVEWIHFFLVSIMSSFSIFSKINQGGGLFFQDKAWMDKFYFFKSVRH